MASFTAAGNSTSYTAPRKGDAVSIAISGTYAQVIELQKERGSPGSGAWQTIKTYSTANATVADLYTASMDNESLRLFARAVTSGTATATLSANNRSLGSVKDGPAGATILEYKQNGIAARGAIERVNGTTDQTGATLTVTAEQHAGKVISLNRAAGVTVTLPAATGTGNEYTFFVATTVTSNNDIIKVANSTDIFAGTAWVAQDAGDTVVAFETAADSDTITMNGSTKEGIKGDKVVIVDVASGIFSVQAFLSGTSTEATPFSATV